MDKRVIFAVAGSGKTTHIVERLNLEERALIVTYTENNFAHLRSRVLQKFGYMPENIKIFTYFTFLHSFCFQPFLQMRLKTRGITFQQPPLSTAKIALNNINRYVDGNRRLYHNRLAKLLVEATCVPEINKRIETYFDYFFVDEVQDFGGHDFNFLLKISTAKVRVLFVGDFYQHTFDTSKDGNVNKNLHDNIGKYEKNFSDIGFVVDKSTLISSRRCSSDVCDFIKSNLLIEMCSHTSRVSKVMIVEAEEQADALYQNNSIVKLFYESHYKYNCYSHNWGASKGLDHYQDVCVVLNKGTWQKLKRGTLQELAPMTRNKIYVACSRARGDLFLVPDIYFKKYLA
ncbi:AAA family ATPase [Acinetobacter sp. AS167]|uniref:AAA family ATPase n=1 Tax=Acinetobacter sp. AS167 TaxID=3127884 RepID=UPI0030178354